MLLSVWFALALTCAIASGQTTNKAISEEKLESLLAEYNSKLIAYCNRVQQTSWDVATDVGKKEKENANNKAVLANAEYQKGWWQKYWKDLNIDDYKSETLRRQLRTVKQLGDGVLTPERLEYFNNLVTKMSSIYNVATVCPYEDQNCGKNAKNRLTLDPDIEKRLSESHNFDELKYYWLKWRDESGKLMRKDYENYVDVMNEIAKGNGYANAGDYWKSSFEDPKFEEKIDALWLKVKPLYDALHSYMRYKLIDIYGDKIDRNDENIPAHLLGNMWAQSWNNLYALTRPFESVGPPMDTTGKMRELKYNALKMFKVSDEFYMSLGLPTNNMSYTGPSLIEKPKDRIVQCHASAWDFCNGKNFRIKMCTSITENDLITIHHEMGHIQYFIQYKDQPSVLRTGANPGFHEAIGDTIALSVANPRHLLKIGLLDKFEDTKENNINALYKQALERVAFLPFGLLIDKWRWDVFSEKVGKTEWNKHWWSLRKKYQKITPPVERSENDFDPGAKFHVPANSQYISYFVSHILEFSFYKSLCIEAGEYGPNKPGVPLHACDFYKSKEAGKKFSDGLKLGGSRHWSEVLKIMTGESEMSADAFLEYFKPLHDYLIKENKKSRRRLAKQ